MPRLPHSSLTSAALLSLLAGPTGCATRPAVDEPTVHVVPTPAPATTPVPATAASGALPPGANDASARLAASPRHGEWVMIPTSPGASDSVRAWVVYPERATKAPVVVVVHEIFGLSTWIRAVADQLAADGFIAIAPDMLTGKRPTSSPDTPPDSAPALVRSLTNDEIQRYLDAVARHGRALPASNGRYGIVGFCWGGGVVWAHAAHAGAALGAGVSYYGPTTSAGDFTAVRAPILGLYGSDDTRVNSTVPRADSTMRALGRSFGHETFSGAGHGFLRQQDGRNGANLAATQGAWPRTIAWFRQHLGG
jgi:carboxymethylenebutenolidase